MSYLQGYELRLHRAIEPTTFGKGYKVLDYCFARMRLARAAIILASSSLPVFM